MVAAIGPPQALVFDLDGTLLDSLPMVLESYALAIRDLGGPSYSHEEILDSFAIGPAAEMLARLIGRPVGVEAVARFERHLCARAPCISLYPGIAPLLEALVGRFPLGIFTAADTSAAEILLKVTGIRARFDAVVGGDQAGRPKPAPDGLLKVCQAIGVASHHAAYVGDGASDMACARACGARALAAGWGHQFEPDRRADRILRHPRELLEYLEAPSHGHRGDSALGTQREAR